MHKTTDTLSNDWSWATVMVVDDEDINRALLAGIARREGIGVVIQACDGLDCLAKLETVVPDLIILDIVMPNLDGFATCARIRAVPAWADIPILVQTALTTPQDVLACFEAGASDVVAKPIRPAELSARLRVHLENRRMLRTLRDANQRIAREMQGAREMQRTLFPSPEILERLHSKHGLSIEGRVDPLDGVGGDFWSLHPLSENVIALMLADFSGHGLMAALNTFWLHAFVGKEAAAMRDPATFLKLLNQALRANLMRGHFATVFFALIDLEKDELRWAGAGAPKPVLQINGEFLQLETTGLPLGLTDRAVYTNHAIAFPPGASLVAFSDGLTDLSGDDGNRLEAHGVLERLQPHLRLHPHSSVDAVFDAVIPQGHGEMADDTTVVVVRRHHANHKHHPDNRHIKLSGLEPRAMVSWAAKLALPLLHQGQEYGEYGPPIHFIAEGRDQELGEAFAHPFAGIIEVAPGHLEQMPPEELAMPAGPDRLLVSLTTTTAYRLPVAMLFCEALAAQGLTSPAAKGNILLSLQEAVANGVVHGNLELHSPRRAFENMRAYWAEIRRRLSDPEKANRRITLDAHIHDKLLHITVTDQGRGFNPEQVQNRDPARPHGKGLKLINQLTMASEISLGGRQHTLTFARDAG